MYLSCWFQGRLERLTAMWKRMLLTASAMVLGMSGAAVLTGLLNRAAPVPVDPIVVGVEHAELTGEPTLTLPPGPAIAVSPTPVALVDVDDDDDSDDEDDSGDDDVGDGDD